jgi:fatty acid desaturase
MKTSQTEIDILSRFGANKSDIPAFTSEQEEQIKAAILIARDYAKNNPTIHFLLQLFPYLVLFSAWLFVILLLPRLIENTLVLTLVLGALHGMIGYQWVIYGMHEGAGHGLFRKRNSQIEKLFNWLAFHSCRLFMADPEFYAKAHKTHHRYLGTIEDQAQTNYVHTRRVLISLLPGAGILFPNDYRIHKGDDLSFSLVVSGLIGGARLALEISLLANYLHWSLVILAFGLIGPWIGLSLDRIRESIEHHLMPADKVWGTRELGLSFMALVIAGGPWGQPCHFTHHLAQDLNWYQQLLLHKKLKTILSSSQQDFISFRHKGIFSLLRQNIKSRISILKQVGQNA